MKAKQTMKTGKQWIALLLVFCMAVCGLPGLGAGSTAEAAAAKLKVTPSKTQTIAVGEKLTFQAEKKSGKVVWSTSNKNVAAVSQKGVVTGKKAGTAKITAAVKGTKVTRKVKVAKAASKVKLPSKAAMTAGDSKTLKAKFSPKGTKSLLKWKSSNKKVATVSSQGKIKALRAGTAVITATMTGKKAKSTCKITVKEKIVLAKSVTLGQAAVGLKEGQTSQISATVLPADTTHKAVTYATSNAGVATVSGTGLITAVKKGSAVITVTTADGSNKTAQLQVVVNPVLASDMNVAADKTTLAAGQTLQINAAVSPANASIQTLKYTSSDPYAAEVSETGLITAKAQGFTTITVETVDGSNIKKSFDLNVNLDLERDPRPRAIVTTDGEVDDRDSLIRFLLYANEVDFAGIVQSSSSIHWQGSEAAYYEAGKVPYRWPGTEWLNDLLNGYEEVYSNLVVHDPGYATPNYLRSITKIGNIGFRGDMTGPTEGSDLIKEAILDDDPRTLYIQAWGGPNTIAVALKEIEDEYKDTPEWPELYKKICKKVVLNVCGLQDETYDRYIGIAYPDMTLVTIGFGVFAYSTRGQGTPEMQRVLSGEWMREHLDYGHGALLDQYVTWGDGTYLDGEVPGAQFGTNEDMLNSTAWWAGTAYERYHFISEGDSPTYFFLFDTGLRDEEAWNYGGYSGRYIPAKKVLNGVTLPHYYSSARDYVTTEGAKSSPRVENAQLRWTEYLQHDFAVRADWCIENKYENANHRPDITIEEGLDITAEPGERVQLHAKTSDPDGDYVSVNWWHYYEAGKDINGSAENETLDINGADSDIASFTIPADAKRGDTFHIIATAQDDGEHSLTYNQRVIVTVGESKEYSMTVKATKAVAKENIVRSNLGGEDRQLWVEFEPAKPGLGVTWSSSDESIMTVSNYASGTSIYTTMTVKGDGPVTIRATANDGSGKYAEIKLTAKMTASSVALAAPEGITPSNVPLGATVTLVTTVKPAMSADNLNWESSDSSVATVVNGVVTPLKAGTTMITATAKDGGGARGVIRLTFVAGKAQPKAEANDEETEQQEEETMGAGSESMEEVM